MMEWPLMVSMSNLHYHQFLLVIRKNLGSIDYLELQFSLITIGKYYWINAIMAKMAMVTHDTITMLKEFLLVLGSYLAGA